MKNLKNFHERLNNLRAVNKSIKILSFAFAISLLTFNCTSNDDTVIIDQTPDFSGVYVQEDQMGRPAVNTVFVSAAAKDDFNVTPPSSQSAAFQSMFQTNLEGLSPAFANPGDMNALGQTSAAFTGLLATDVLNVSLDGTTTFYDGTNVLTGRALADDVITVELLLIFGGEDFSENPGLSNDNVDANDKTFLTSFPYLASPW
ncbi:DUF4331 family protein [uncultured Wocania sp.]|uniref:DUF4331 family protein n=1 Tax=uncultured Wocania sp. TaxID=2834404 RepID=UPI0030F50771